VGAAVVNALPDGMVGTAPAGGDAKALEVKAPDADGATGVVGEVGTAGEVDQPDGAGTGSALQPGIGSV
jgi:hypothetical protein